MSKEIKTWETDGMGPELDSWDSLEEMLLKIRDAIDEFLEGGDNA